MTTVDRSHHALRNYRTGGCAKVTRDRTTRNDRSTVGPSRNRTSRPNKVNRNAPVFWQRPASITRVPSQRRKRECPVSREQSRTAIESVFDCFLMWECQGSVPGKTNSVGTIPNLIPRVPARPRVHIAASSVYGPFRFLG